MKFTQPRVFRQLTPEDDVLRIGFVLALLLAPLGLAAQSPTGQLVSDAYRAEFELNAGRLIAAADDMPADRYGFRPTPAQMSFAEVVVHLIQGNDDIGSVVGATAPPHRTTVTAADSKAVLVARLKETFAFCRSALARVTDSMLGDPLADYGDRAHALFSTINHWSDHYSQMAMYLRLNGVLPPTARGGPMVAPAPDSRRGVDAGRSGRMTMPGHPAHRS